MTTVSKPNRKPASAEVTDQKKMRLLMRASDLNVSDLSRTTPPGDFIRGWSAKESGTARPGVSIKLKRFVLVNGLPVYPFGAGPQDSRMTNRGASVTTRVEAFVRPGSDMRANNSSTAQLPNRS